MSWRDWQDKDPAKHDHEALMRFRAATGLSEEWILTALERANRNAWERALRRLLWTGGMTDPDLEAGRG